MDDFLPFLLTVSGIILILLAGLAVYVLSFFIDLKFAAYIVFGLISLILCPIVYWLTPNIDNKDAIIALRAVVSLVFLASVAILAISLVKAFAIK